MEAREELIAAAPGVNWRPLAFRVSMWTLIAVLYFFSPFVLVVLGWFQEPFSDLGGAESVSHRVHEVLFGVIFAQAMAGAVSQLLNPIERRAGMLQTLAVLFGFVGALAAIGVVEALGLAFVALAVAATLLHPAGRTLWLSSWRPKPGLMLLAASGTIPLLFLAIDNFAKAKVQAADHLSHWGGVSAFAIVQILLVSIASLRPPGYRLVAGSVGVGGLAYFAASRFFPFDASARPQAFAVWLCIWALAWLGVAVIGERQTSVMAIVGTVATIALLASFGVAGLAIGLFVGAVLAFLIRRREVFPRFLTIGFSVLGYILVLGGGLIAFDAGEAPNVPHGLAGGYESATRQTCLDCHADGAYGATLIPHSSQDQCGGPDDPGCWDGRRDCLGCHRYDPALGGPTEFALGWAPVTGQAPSGGPGLSSQQLAVADGFVKDPLPAKSDG